MARRFPGGQRVPALAALQRDQSRIFICTSVHAGRWSRRCNGIAVCQVVRRITEIQAKHVARDGDRWRKFVSLESLERRAQLRAENLSHGRAERLLVGARVSAAVQYKRLQRSTWNGRQFSELRQNGQPLRMRDVRARRPLFAARTICSRPSLPSASRYGPAALACAHSLVVSKLLQRNHRTNQHG